MLNKHNTHNEMRMLDFSKRGTDYNNVIVVDIDEVIWGINHSYLEEVNKHMGTNFTVDQIISYNMCQCLGIPYDVLTHVLNNTDAFSRIKVFQHSHSMINGLREGTLPQHYGLMNEPHSVIFITHRGFRPDGFKITHDLLVQHNLIPDMLIAAPLGMSKLDIADDLFGHNLCGIIEDKPETLQEFSEAGFLTIKSDKPWNKNVWSDYTIDLSKQLLPI